MKILNNLKVLISCKFEFILPQKSDVVIWGAPTYIEILIKKYIPRSKKVNIIHIWGEKLNLLILLKCFLKLKFSLLDYTNEYIKVSKPKIIISFQDNYESFYKIKSEKNQKKILIQNAWRSDENNFFEKQYLINSRNVDYIFVQNFPIKKKYQYFSKSIIYPIGSFLSNHSSIKSKSKKYDLLFVSTLRLDAEVSNLNFSKIKNADPIKYEGKLVKHIYEYCKLNDLILCILPARKIKQTFFEKNFFESLLGTEDDWKYLERNNNDFSFPYNTIDQSKIVVGIDSTLQYESFARGIKTIFFDIRPKNNYLAKKRHFGWPKKYEKDGLFWTSKNEKKEIHKLIENVRLINSKKWKKIKKKYEKNLMVSNDKNTMLKKIIREIV